MPYKKEEDIYNYVKAEEFFHQLNSNPNQYHRIRNVELCLDADRKKGTIKARRAGFRDLETKRLFIIEFIRPTVFRIRFHPAYQDLDDYHTTNPFNPDKQNVDDLMQVLDELEADCWDVHVEDQGEFVKIQSHKHEKKDEMVYMRIHVRKTNLMIVAARELKRRSTGLLQRISKDFLFDSLVIEGREMKVVWMTKPSGILFSGKTTVIEVEKPSMARYLGFGEQGGRQLLKSKVIVDYFNYDNMTYSQVYGRGALDTREPLYHSEPFWMEVAQHPGHNLKIGTLVDNLSQICLDIGSKDNSMIRIATRFGAMKAYVLVGDSVGDLIASYTSIVGRPRLKPRYVLGYHQGCYGYETADMIRKVVRKYKEHGFPLDGIHIDVDIQDKYRTFTIDERPDKFGNPAGFFSELRAQGIKCGTNITPFINADEPLNPTCDELIANKYYIKDYRYRIDMHGPSKPSDEQYMLYRGGHVCCEPKPINKNAEPKHLYEDPDEVPLGDTWNTGGPFRGGVWYGGNRGRPGYYPDLNREDVRDWWGNQYKPLVKHGLEFVWQDMTGPCMGAAYGDMRSFPFRLVLSGGRASHDPDKNPNEKPDENTEIPAIELWSLYSSNLHKATFDGWENMEERYDHDKKKFKRNFIIGRGGFVGLHRYAGLWTGDNASSWDFLKVSVAQVLSLGLSGITISGGDVGGFEPEYDWNKWASPELVMRWYCAYSLLPWFRNHYNAKGKKQFQEPYEFINHIHEARPGEEWMYKAVLDVCLYHVRLRYSLMQLLYDQMFNNLLTGLPIARSLIITNEIDLSLFGENARFLDDEYLVGDDLLVAPVLTSQAGRGNVTRMVYLPRPTAWWQSNLRENGPNGAKPLENDFSGGSLIPFYAHIDGRTSQLSWTTPMFIKYGAIIPQIEPRGYAEDHKDNPNRVSIHIYPCSLDQEKRSYDMFLDDGVSRESAPSAVEIKKYLARERGMAQETVNAMKLPTHAKFGDPKANDEYWRARIGQEIDISGKEIKRKVSFEITGPSNIRETIRTIFGTTCQLIIWAKPQPGQTFNHESLEVTPTEDLPQGYSEGSRTWEDSKKAWFVELPLVEGSKYEVKVPH